MNQERDSRANLVVNLRASVIDARFGSYTRTVTDGFRAWNGFTRRPKA
jgi:hypothetical protein